MANPASASRRVASSFAALLIIAVPVIGWLERWQIYDWWRLRGYSAPAAVSQLATDTTMDTDSRQLFYVYHPELDDKAAFNQNCKVTEQTIVLGCYVDAQGIYLLNVTDARLAGVLQVTAAHEMLHAAYGRLSTSERKHVDAMVNAAYAQVTDPRIRQTIADYQKNGADVANELHSILGTEVRSLPADLEHYYARYFTNRAAIVDYSEHYEDAFQSRKNEVANDDQQLGSLKQQIDSNEASLSIQEANLTVARDHLNSLLAAKDFAGYNAGVPGYNAQVNSYNALVQDTRSLIDRYNQLVAARNAIALEESDLVKAIDSRPSTIEQQ